MAAENPTKRNPGAANLSPRVKPIRAITLDLDNTLWDIEPVIEKAEALLWEWLCKHYPQVPDRFCPEDMLTLRQNAFTEYPHKVHDFRYLRTRVLERVATESGYDTSLVAEAFAIFDDARNRVELYPEVLRDLEYLFGRCRIVAVTNGNANLDRIGIRHLFHDVVTAAAAGAAKPARLIFDIAIRTAGVSADEILHVGDHPETDIEGARLAGLRTAWMNRHGAPWPEDYAAPDFIIASISDLREILADGGPASA